MLYHAVKLFLTPFHLQISQAKQASQVFMHLYAAD